MAPNASSAPSQIGPWLFWPASSGTRAISGTEAMSWNSSTEKASRPEVRASSLRSASNGSTIAVEDRVRPSPRMAAPGRGAPAMIASPVSRAPVTATWAAPKPNTERRIDQMRGRRSSRPMMNSNIRTPSSLISEMLATSVTSLKPEGPIRAPATR